MRRVKFVCVDCNQESSRKIDSYKNFMKCNDAPACVKCARKRGALKRPQNSESFLQNIRKSEAYYSAISRRDTSGEKNGMYGKKGIARYQSQDV